MTDIQRYNVTITYATDLDMLWRDKNNYTFEAGILRHEGLKGSEVRTLISKYMEAGEITPMNSLRPFDVHVEPVGWKDLQKEAIRRRDEAIKKIQGRPSIGADQENE